MDFRKRWNAAEMDRWWSDATQLVDVLESIDEAGSDSDSEIEQDPSDLIEGVLTYSDSDSEDDSIIFTPAIYFLLETPWRIIIPTVIPFDLDNQKRCEPFILRISQALISFYL
jgi:hypothetical protein